MLNDMLSEISQTEKVRYHMISLLYRILKKKKKNTDTENRMGIARARCEVWVKG